MNAEKYAVYALVRVWTGGEEDDRTGREFLTVSTRLEELLGAAGEPLTTTPSSWWQEQQWKEFAPTLLDPPVREEYEHCSARASYLWKLAQESPMVDDGWEDNETPKEPVEPDFRGVVQDAACELWRRAEEILAPVIDRGPESDCFIDCNPHRYYEVVRLVSQETTVATWYPVECCDDLPSGAPSGPWLEMSTYAGERLVDYDDEDTEW